MSNEMEFFDNKQNTKWKAYNCDGTKWEGLRPHDLRLWCLPSRVSELPHSLIFVN